MVCYTIKSSGFAKKGHVHVKYMKKIKLNPKSVDSNIISALISEKLGATDKNSNVKQGVSLADIATKLVAKKFPKKDEETTENTDEEIQK